MVHGHVFFAVEDYWTSLPIVELDIADADQRWSCRDSSEVAETTEVAETALKLQRPLKLHRPQRWSCRDSAEVAETALKLQRPQRSSCRDSAEVPETALKLQRQRWSCRDLRSRFETQNHTWFVNETSVLVFCSIFSLYTTHLYNKLFS